jgi:hypothetical protein
MQFLIDDDSLCRFDLPLPGQHFSSDGVVVLVADGVKLTLLNSGNALEDGLAVGDLALEVYVLLRCIGGLDDFLQGGHEYRSNCWVI